MCEKAVEIELSEEASTFLRLTGVIGDGTGGNARDCSDFIQCVEHFRSVPVSAFEAILLRDAECLYPGVQQRMLGRKFTRTTSS